MACAAVLLCMVAICAAMGAERRAPPTEYQVKAVFVYNFAKFIQWPAKAFADGDGAFVVGVVGADPFGDLLANTLRDQAVGAHPMQLRRFAPGEDFTQCHVLFIGRSEQPRIKSIIEATSSVPVLTVSEGEGFPDESGIINFSVVDATVRFDINNLAALRSRLTVSSKLLKLARRVVNEEGKTGP